MISMHANLEIARRALQTHQLAMSVIGTNIANVNTPGYSRRRAVVQSSSDLETGSGRVGAGAEITDIRRVRDSSLDRIFREHRSGWGRWSGIHENLSKVESVLNEPGSAGLSSAMGAFWGAWQNLANEPENLSVRAEVQLRATQLTDVFHRLSSNLESLREGLRSDIVTTIEVVNQKAARLAEINRMTVKSEFGGHEASALRDERDLLMDELSELVNVTVEEQSNGSYTVMVGSQVLVQSDTSRALELAPGGRLRSQPSRVVWEDNGQAVNIEGGVLRAYMSARDEFIPDYLEDLDALAGELVAQINGIHSMGYGLDGSTGNNFFDAEKVTAEDISLDIAILESPDRIAASLEGQMGDGRNATAIADLRSALAMSESSATFDDFYNTLVGRIGLESREAESFLQAEEILLHDIEDQRLGISGVSLDEEMSYLVSYQHAYEAMVRVASAIDEMMETLIVSLGA